MKNKDSLTENFERDAPRFPIKADIEPDVVPIRLARQLSLLDAALNLWMIKNKCT